MGCEIWVKVTAAGETPPAGADELSFVSLDTASPYIAEYDGSDGGKTAHYMLRWVKSSGDKGPWSETVSATIKPRKCKTVIARTQRIFSAPYLFLLPQEIHL